VAGEEGSTGSSAEVGWSTEAWKCWL